MRSGAIVYVVDFAGTGQQFSRGRNWAAHFFVGSFSEFFLAPVICEEAERTISELGAVIVASLKHSIGEKRLHPDNHSLPDRTKQRLVSLSEKIGKRQHRVLGFKQLATMVVLYRSAPNTTPLILLGSRGQSPCTGIFPRSNDLPL
jgi:hypothetical protein